MLCKLESDDSLPKRPGARALDWSVSRYHSISGPASPTKLGWLKTSPDPLTGPGPLGALGKFLIVN